VEIPSSYKDGYLKARAIDAERADNYVAHTMIGDPVADAAAEDLEQLGQEESARLIHAGLHGKNRSGIRDAPETVRKFFDTCFDRPDWVDMDSFGPGCEMFHRNSRMVLAGMVGGVLVEGFSTNIAKSFFLTGRLRDRGVRRLRQNNRHMLEIFFPEGLDIHNDGWAHSIRVRLVHSRVRSMLIKAGEWDVGEFGTPISSANLGFAISAFSARLLHHLRNLGGRFTQEERESFMAVWRYSGYLMGIPETILFMDEEDALAIFDIGRICEPPPSMESIALASSLINSAPLLIGLSDARSRRTLSRKIMDISREMIGDELADQLMYDKQEMPGALWRFRLLNRIGNLKERLTIGTSPRAVNLTTILNLSLYDQKGIDYRMPTRVYSEEAGDW